VHLITCFVTVDIKLLACAFDHLFCNSRYQNKFMFDMYCINDSSYHDSILISQLMKKKNVEDLIEEVMILWQKIFLLVSYSHLKVYVLIINPESSID
jgi:hypothetical protein